MSDFFGAMIKFFAKLDGINSNTEPKSFIVKITGKKYYVQRIKSNLANFIIKRYHYSGKVVSNTSLHLGVFNQETNDLVGCLQYGCSMNGSKTTDKLSSPDSVVLELNRNKLYMCL